MDQLLQRSTEFKVSTIGGSLIGTVCVCCLCVFVFFICVCVWMCVLCMMCVGCVCVCDLYDVCCA